MSPHERKKHRNYRNNNCHDECSNGSSIRNVRVWERKFFLFQYRDKANENPGENAYQEVEDVNQFSVRFTVNYRHRDETHHLEVFKDFDGDFHIERMIHLDSFLSEPVMNIDMKSPKGL